VSARGSLPDDSPALGESPVPLVFLTGSTAPLPAAARPVHAIRTADGDPTRPMVLRPLLRRLRERFGVHRIVCEGGPSLNAALLAEGLVSQLFVSISPVLAREPTARTLLGPGGGAVPLRLLGSTAVDDFVFLRYRVEPPA
jgi:riboflavin biosynthesis pyrimidine reductase